jgi:hypothetical protein
LKKHLHIQALDPYINMPTDVHGITHAGTIGLFDDDDENAASLARAERHEIQGLEKYIRCRERRSRKLRKENKAADGLSPESSGRAKLSRSASWFGHLLNGGKEHSPELAPILSSDEKHDNDDKKIPEIRVEDTAEWAIVRRPEAPAQVYTAQDVDPVDSPFLRECGMVRVVSDDASGCHIVPKSRIEKND